MGNLKGFTLIELVVVISLLGILAAIVIPSYVGFNSEARVANLNALKGALYDAVQMTRGMYYSKGGSGATVDLGNGLNAVDVVAKTSTYMAGQPKGTASGIRLVVTYEPSNFTFSSSASGGNNVAKFILLKKDGLTPVDSLECIVTYDDNASTGDDPIVTVVGTKC